MANLALGAGADPSAARQASPMPGVDQAADHDREQHIRQSGRARRQGDHRRPCSRYGRGGTPPARSSRRYC